MGRVTADLLRLATVSVDPPGITLAASMLAANRRSVML